MVPVAYDTRVSQSRGRCRSDGTDFGHRDRAAEARRERCRLDDFDGMQARARVDGGVAIRPARIEKCGELQLQGLVAADLELFLAAIERVPRRACADMLAHVQRD